MNWITIPFADNYEVNKKNIVRNKRTKRILHPNKKNQYRLFLSDGSEHCFKRDDIYSRAVLSVKESWETVHSLNGRYELSGTGKLRNAATKKLLKLVTKRHATPFYRVTFQNNDGVSFHTRVTLENLMWEVYGESVLPKKFGTRREVVVTKGNICKLFKSIQSAVDFLSSVLYYSKGYLSTLMSKRYPDIFGWKIKYLNYERRCYDD